MILISLIVPFFAIIFEIYPRILNPKIGVDIWTHLLYLKEYHRQGGLPKKIGKKQGFLVSGEYDYPPVLIWILSKFPFEMVEKYDFLFSPFFDMLHLLLIFYMSYFLTGNLFVSLLTQILYSLTPIIILENSTATPRSLGYTLFSTVFMSIFLFNTYNNLAFLLIALIAGSLIFLSHRFTTQAFLFYVVFFSILERNIIYALIFFFCFILAIISSKGFYLKVLRGHIGNLLFWRKNIRYRFMHQIRGVNLDHQNGDIILKLYQKFMKFPPFVIAVTNPWTVPIFYIILFPLSDNAMYTKMIWWVIFSYLLALATSIIPFFRFLGESQRYLELSAFPAAFLSSLLLISLQDTIFGVYFQVSYMILALSAFITIVVIQRKAIIKDTLRTITPNMEKMFEYLKSLRQKPYLLCIPHQITTNTIYHTGCPVFVNADYANINKISEVYPHINMPVVDILKAHNLDMVLLNEDYASISDLQIKKYTIINKIGNFVLIKPII